MLETIQTPTAAHTRYPPSPAAATLHGKMQGLQFTLRFSATRTHPCSHYTAICIHPLSPPAATLHGKKHKVLCSGSSPKQSPCNSHAAIKMRFAATRTHPCSHSNAICIHTLQNARNDPNRNRRTHKVPFIAACSHFPRKNTRLRAPKQSPCNRHAAITVTTSQGHHFPRSTLLLVTTS